MQKLRFLKVLWQPVLTTREWAGVSRWWPPLLASGFVAAGVQVLVVERLGFDRLMYAAVRAESVQAGALLAQLEAQRWRILTLQCLASFMDTAMVAVVSALVVWLVSVALGAVWKYRKVLASVTLAQFFATAVRHGMLLGAVCLVDDPLRLRWSNPLATNPAFFFRAHSAVWNRLLECLDLLTFAQMGLLIYGLMLIRPGGCKRVAFAAVLLPWSAWTAIRCWWVA
ncbi:MAG TPA: hypothetical protein P5057_04440 [Acidobacteriota bacterium]|nr:hypothetical protein [Acidobacteriota bacterium]HRR56192.1 hypothetical protein [Acidobacteriota bacterium]